MPFPPVFASPLVLLVHVFFPFFPGCLFLCPLFLCFFWVAPSILKSLNQIIGNVGCFWDLGTKASAAVDLNSSYVPIFGELGLNSLYILIFGELILFPVCLVRKGERVVIEPSYRVSTATMWKILRKSLKIRQTLHGLWCREVVATVSAHGARLLK